MDKKYEIDWDKVQTLEEMKTVLKAIKIGFGEEYANSLPELKPLLKEKEGEQYEQGTIMENTSLLMYFVLGLVVFKTVFIVSFICINIGLCKKKEEHGKEF